MDQDIDDLRQRIQGLEDREEIRQLYVDYGRNLDARDIPAYASLFGSQAEVRLPGVLQATGADIERAASEVFSSNVDGRRDSAHLIGAPHLAIDGDTATGEAVWIAVSRSSDGPPAVFVGRHVDRFEREDGRWVFASREAHLDIG